MTCRVTDFPFYSMRTNLARIRCRWMWCGCFNLWATSRAMLIVVEEKWPHTYSLIIMPVNVTQWNWACGFIEGFQFTFILEISLWLTTVQLPTWFPAVESLFCWFLMLCLVESVVVIVVVWISCCELKLSKGPVFDIANYIKWPFRVATWITHYDRLQSNCEKL